MRVFVGLKAVKSVKQVLREKFGESGLREGEALRCVTDQGRDESEGLVAVLMRLLVVTEARISCAREDLA